MKSVKWILFSLFVAQFNLAQNKLVDSIYQVSLLEKSLSKQVDFLNDSSVKYKTKDFDTANSLAQKALELATKNNYSDGIALANRNLGIVSMNQGKYDQAESYYNSALSASKSPKVLGQVYGSIGRLKAEVSDFLGCVKYQFKALELFEKTQSYDLQYVTLYNIANTYIQLNEIEKYKEYKNKAQAVKELIDKQKATVLEPLLPTSRGQYKMSR